MTEIQNALTVFVEEVNEFHEAAFRASTRASKTLRFGPDEIQPGQDKTNGERLAEEVGDLAGMCQVLRELGLIPQGQIDAKAAKYRKFLEMSIDLGIVGDA